MMAYEGQLLPAVIARMQHPEINLAAFGVTLSLAMMVESPVIMLMGTSAALVKDRESYLKVRNFTYILNTVLTLVMLVISIPQVFRIVSEDIMGLPVSISTAANKGMLFMLPWPAAIGYRRFYQGIMISLNKTKRVAAGTIARMVSLTMAAFALFFIGGVEGNTLGAISLTIGVVTEALFTKLMAFDCIRTLNDLPSSGPVIRYKEILKFYYPLAMTSVITLSIHPSITFFMAWSYRGVESLAVLPVINGLVFFFRSIGLSYQEVPIALLKGNKENYKMLRNFAVTLAAVLVGTLSLIAYTPAAEFFFNSIAGLTPQLADFAALPLMILAFMPAMSVLYSYQRGMLIALSKTKPITNASIIEIISVFSILFFCTKILVLPGAVAAAVTYVFSRGFSNLYLMNKIKL